MGERAFSLNRTLSVWQAASAKARHFLRALGTIHRFSASEALSAALGAGVVNTTADIGTAIAT
jgi:hypothetical protein